jgi:hypothetical protein
MRILAPKVLIPTGSTSVCRGYSPPKRQHDTRYVIEEVVVEATPSPLPPLTPIERRAFDYTALEEAMAHLDAVVRTSRFALRSIVDGTHGAAVNPSPNRAETAPDC